MMENRNYILAIVLSLGILVAWQYVYVGPQMEAERERLEAQQAATAAGDPTSPITVDETAPGAPVAGGLPAVAPLERGAVIASSERIAIETSHITGSISLTGARLDDIHLEEYRETLDEDSDTVVLFSPSGSADPFYAEFGWAQGGGGAATLPDASTVWQVEGNDTLTPSSPVTLVWENEQGLIFRRTIAVDDDYMFTIRQEVENTSDAGVLLYPYGLVARHGEPPTSRLFILHEGMIGWFGGDDGLAEVDYGDIRDDGSQQFRDVSGGWLGITDKYWAAALIPSGLDAYRGEFRVDQIASGESFVSAYLGGGFEIAAGASVAIENNLFAGAKEVAIVDGYEASLGVERFELLIDWGWFYFLTKPMFFGIKWLFGIFGNFGVAILLITVAIKLVFLPLANKSYASMSKMKKVQPQLKEIQERYKDDKPELQKQMMALYQKEKINPVAGCWPVLIQIPVFFALYKVLFVTIEMRHAPFFGWIQDLSAADPTSIFNLFGLLPYDPTLVPLIGPLLGLGIWPILMGLTMFVQMKLNPQPTDPTQAMIFTWMPIIFTFMLATFPAGLVIYWTWNNFLSIIQQAAIMKRHGVKIELMDNLRAMIGKKPDKQPAE
ncbi:MAG: membrane protein insertase YidC [Devosiaceae bacterium]|nr:membrane protein insertase YidC [Devosiaceae bacterium MH13]